MASRRRRVSAGGLAGWLFADLALVLAFVFLDSSTPGQAHGKDPSKGKSTTTTVAASSTTSSPPPGKKGNGGARPKPYEITIAVSPGMSATEIIEAVQAGLDDTAAVREGKDTVYLVVIALGGSMGGNRTRGSALAQEVCDKLESDWSHVVRGTTFFQPGDDSGLADGQVKLKLFPTQKAGN